MAVPYWNNYTEVRAPPTLYKTQIKLKTYIYIYNSYTVYMDANIFLYIIHLCCSLE